MGKILTRLRYIYTSIQSSPRTSVIPLPQKAVTKMEDQIIATSKTVGAVKANNGGGQQLLETTKSERHVWLMKCPPIVSRSLTQQQQQQQPQLSTPLDASSAPIGAKVVVTVDPLLPNNDFSSTQVHCRFVLLHVVKMSTL